MPSRPRLPTGLLLSAALAALLAVPASAQFVPEPDPAPTDTPAGDGVQVHGRWTVTITNPDGSVTDRHVFQNALFPGGSALLAGLLTGQAAITNGQPTWVIGLSLVRFGLTPSATYTLIEGTETQNGGIDQPWGVRLVSRIGPLDAAAEIEQVFTRITNLTTQIGDFPDSPIFTLRDLSPSIPVVAGQSVDITVEITFS